VQPAEREDRRALAAALHRYPDINPIGRTPMVTRNGERVTCHGACRKARVAEESLD
jgi:hypothetical protein